MTELRDRIIETSLLLFEKHGFHGVTVNDIVNHCGTSKGGFYHHFRSKDELLFVIHDTFITYVLDKAHDAISKYSEPKLQLHAIIQSFAKVFDLYKSHISVFYQESNYLKPQFEQLIKKKRDEFKTIVFQVIQKGQQTGEFRKTLPIEIAGMSLLGMVNWTYKWYQKDGEKSIEEISELFTDIIYHGILTHR
ncbi:AcrR family transcriptional regulator [Pullulanibacillus pueri]|uniref:TetR family transcriptional regulator n=1 Tax=Pullulanibacillus pueri TaxID=1437324 RepID=A0A8J2ZU97_9BACL|nr:TetR/AcrR family transcriptional regulator [Pullulanibacillus pueri]MBM7681296.1 AcrR family transcriptional regulator [Pullulanibacillus pueri]GGH77699.1 TetR family transcriptional regulator [Pullulanibacillus pueri]